MASSKSNQTAQTSRQSRSTPSGSTDSTKASPRTGDSRRGRQRTRECSSENPLSAENLKKRGYHTLNSSYNPFHVENRWRMVRELGQGAYGMVISAEDRISGETIAVKKVTRVFDKLQLAKRALREITLLRHFSTRGHENITGLIDLDVIHPGFNEIYLFMEPMEADLHQIIRSGQKLTNEHVQYFLYQILRGMKYIHTASVIHRDLKPGNILVNSDCELKICDFGLANTFEGVSQLTEYVATRWYRAPEIMLSFRTYGTAIDVWSIGCILAELLLGKPLFRGKDYVDQLNRILNMLGTPNKDVFDKIASEKAKAYLRSLPIRKPQPFQKAFPMMDTEALDLLQRMITWDPDKRITVIEALKHPWVSNYHDPIDEPVCPSKFDRYNEYEHLTTLEEFREAIWKEIQDFRREVRSLHPPLTPEIQQKQAETMLEEPPLIPTLVETLEEHASKQQTVAASPLLVPEKAEEAIAPNALAPAQTADEPIVPRTEEPEQLDNLPPPIPRDQSTLVATSDPIVTYRRRSSVLQASTSPRASVYHQHQPFPSTGNESGSEGPYIVPARSRAASIIGGQSQLLRALSTFSIHEQVEPELTKKLLAATTSEAPPSSIPQEFADTDKAA